MEEVTLETGVNTALDAIFQDRFATICGAGLSMAPPSNLPSAWTIAQSAKQRYDAIHGANTNPLSEDIEEQAEFFHAQGQLETMYLGQLVDHDTFSGPPNEGHFAIADMLLTKAMGVVLSTNVDALIENAGDSLFGGIVTATTRDNAAALYPAKAPLLKIHGCWKSNPQQTVWAPSQLNCEPNQTRIAECADWVAQQLLNRDLIIVGFFTDWDYLNALIEQCLGAVHPSNVIVVDPSPTADLEAKAPALFTVGENAGGEFYHVRESGSDFLLALRKQWSISFIRRVFTAGNTVLSDEGDPRAHANLCEPPDAIVDDLWAMRRDLEGVGPNSACKNAAPVDDPQLGYAHVILRAAGAELDGTHWLLNGQRIRIIRGAGRPLNVVEKEHASSVSPLASADVTIAAGALDFALKPDIARSADQSSVVRAQASRFMSLQQAEEELLV